MLGVRRLTLVDPDRLERHNLGEMSCVHDREVGMHKVDALAGGLRRTGFARAEPIAKSVLSFAALGALKQADVIMACADSPAPRLAAAILATAYLQPCLDVGTGILNRAGARDMGADVRLLLPGRCAWCVGGVPRWPAARDALLLGDAPPVPADFREQRMGSLRSLNSLAVSLAMTLLEQYASNRLRDSVWLQADVSEHGLPSVVARHARKVERCPICVLAGLGDSALALLPGVLRQLQ